MTSYSILDRTAPGATTLPAGEASGEGNTVLRAEQKVEQGNTTQASKAGISAALAANAATLASSLTSSLPSALRFPGEDGGSSLAAMAQRDLDAALQLLADRAQYITGANGAAIALRRKGKNDMQCRASSGANVPELGALLSTEFGISGESVRTRKPLRCDDAERDPRVNREGCRQLGIASVVVMPVVNDDEVLGVFELFSGKVNAFGERDLSALQRLSEMVETAVKLARAAETIPERLKVEAASAAPLAADVLVDDDILGVDVLGDEITSQETVEDSVLEAAAENPTLGASGAEALKEEENLLVALEGLPAVSTELPPVRETRIDPAAAVAAAVPVASASQPAGQSPLPKKPLFWSASLNPAADADKPAEADQSHVPPVLRSLRTCEVCGFPVSPGRALCVECEEKRWRGQLRRPAAGLPLGRGSQAKSGPKAESRAESKSPPFDTLRAGSLAKDARSGAPTAGNGTAMPKNGGPAVGVPAAEGRMGPVAHLVAVAAQSAAAAAPAAQVVPAIGAVTAPVTPVVAVPMVPEIVRESVPAPASEATESASPDFVLSAGLEPSQSWLRANIYMIVVFLLVAAAAAVTIILH